MDRGPMEYIALGLIVFVGLFLFYAVIVVHGIPYRIAKRRNHPHQEAIHYGGWVSMFTLHAIWPLLWIWATLYHADRGYWFSRTGGNSQGVLDKLDAFDKRLAALEAGRADQSAKSSSAPEAGISPGG